MSPLMSLEYYFTQPTSLTLLSFQSRITNSECNATFLSFSTFVQTLLELSIDKNGCGLYLYVLYIHCEYSLTGQLIHIV